MNKILRFPEVLKITQLSRATIYLKMKKNEFPQSIDLGARAIGWHEQDITNWVESLTSKKAKKNGEG